MPEAFATTDHDAGAAVPQSPQSGLTSEARPVVPPPPLPADEQADGPGLGWCGDADGRWHAALRRGTLPTDAFAAWVGRPSCGAVVVFAGTTRDHGAAPGGGVRTGVRLLEYEAYEGPALERLAAVATSVLDAWPDCGAVAVAHRLGPVPLGEASVVVAVSAPHRDDAFAAARFAIDTIKTSVPIWKLEHHDRGADWGADATSLATPHVSPSSGSPPAGPGDPPAIVRSEASVTDTGGVARRAARTSGVGTPGDDQMADPDPQEGAWAT